MTIIYSTITIMDSFIDAVYSIFRFRSKQLEKYVKAMENQRLKMGSASDSSVGASGSGSRELPSSCSHVARKAQAISMEMTKFVYQNCYGILLQ